jgi:hypothetical protein
VKEKSCLARDDRQNIKMEKLSQLGHVPSGPIFRIKLFSDPERLGSLFLVFGSTRRKIG